MAVRIAQVAEHSPAARKGIEAGDELLCINGHEIDDVLDYRFYVTEERLQLLLRHEGRKRVVTLSGAEEIGLEFDTYLMDRQHTCRNKCVFCFIDQMPPGMRESLYFKDDDSRLSFLFGNYITLTNLTPREAQRMVDMHISPVNVSVHTTNPDLRVKMMGNRFAGETLSLLTKFADAGLELNCQLVLCPEWNDGAELRRSLEDLSRLLPALKSVAAVPVGLTKYREGLTPLRLFTKEEAGAVIDEMEAFGERLLAQTGERIVYPSDEFYLLAERALPDSRFYGDYPQLENGVGTLTLLREEFLDALGENAVPPRAGRRLIATGTAAAPFLNKLVDEARKTWHTLTVEVCAVRNTFFGETITVSGLLTGQDLLAQLRGKAADELLISDSMLRHEGDCFLDDVTLAQLSKELGMPVRVVPQDGGALLDAVMGFEKQEMR